MSRPLICKVRAIFDSQPLKICGEHPCTLNSPDQGELLQPISRPYIRCTEHGNVSQLLILPRLTERQQRDCTQPQPSLQLLLLTALTHAHRRTQLHEGKAPIKQVTALLITTSNILTLSLDSFFPFTLSHSTYRKKMKHLDRLII